MVSPKPRPRGRDQARRDQEGRSSKKDEPKKDETKKEGEPKKEEVAKGCRATKPADAPKADATSTPKTEDDQAKVPFVDVAAEFDADRQPTIKTGGTVLIKDATILTVTRGTIPKGSILIRDGKIAEVGANIVAARRRDRARRDRDGRHAGDHRHPLAPGGAGGVNEMSLSIVPEVRVKDVVTGDDVGIYRALAGGTTAARLLHGSANTIGGQDAVIKHKPGQAGRDLILKDNPQGVKFALGENVTRSDRPLPQHPDGRRGHHRDGRSRKAELTSNMWKAYDAAKASGEAAPPPRRDLRLEALAGILDGSIKIHSHCYRNDEILMLLRTTARYGVRVQSLQHVLEGYKVAAEIAAHGASASTFSDWWAYKIEAFDAIPYQRRPAEPGGRPGLHQERQRGADPPPLPRSRQDGQVRQRARGPGPGHDHDQPGPRAGPRPPARLDRGGQGRRHRDLQRPPLRRLRPLRDALIDGEV